MNDLGNRITKSSSPGFSLLEISVVLLLCSLLVVSGVNLIKAWMDQNTLAVNQQRLNAIQQALTSYQSQKKSLPTPAGYKDPQGTNCFGRITPCPGGVAGGTFPVAPIIIGAVPIRDLGLPDSYISNPYGYRYTYAVATLATTPPMNSTLASVINIKDAMTGAISNATYVVVDHGKDGKGTYTTEGVGPTACAGFGLDVPNCNHYASGYFQTAPFSNNILLLLSWFDDTVRSTPSQTANKACTVVYSAAAPGGTSTGYGQWGYDVGVGIGFGPCTLIACFPIFAFTDTFTYGASNSPSPIISPTATTAYCSNPSYNVVTGGCTQTLGPPPAITATAGPNGNTYSSSIPNTVLFGADINPAGSQIQPVMPPLSHPAMHNAAGTQGWQCNGSSANNIYTQAYAVCCP
jgi:type II secretory pathway pseudopilin PulG